MPSRLDWNLGSKPPKAAQRTTGGKVLRPRFDSRTPRFVETRKVTPPLIPMNGLSAFDEFVLFGDEHTNANREWLRSQIARGA